MSCVHNSICKIHLVWVAFTVFLHSDRERRENSCWIFTNLSTCCPCFCGITMRFSRTHTFAQIEFQYSYYFFRCRGRARITNQVTVVWQDEEGMRGMRPLILFSGDASGAAGQQPWRSGLKAGRCDTDKPVGFTPPPKKASLAVRILSVFSQDKELQGTLTSRWEAPAWVASLIGRVRVLCGRRWYWLRENMDSPTVPHYQNI